jgi:hypothetical protein
LMANVWEEAKGRRCISLRLKKLYVWNIYQHEEEKINLKDLYTSDKGLHTSLDRIRSMLKSSAGLTAESFIDKNCTICTYRIKKLTS